MAEIRHEVAGCVLLNTYKYDFEAFRVQFYDDWKIEIEEEPNTHNYEFNMGDAHIAILELHVKKKEALDGCAMNYEWEGSAEQVSTHVAQLEVGVFGDVEPIRRFVLFTMVAASLMKQDNVVGLYRYPKTYRAADFIEQAEIMKKENLPVGLWVFVGVHRDAEGLWNCYTYGMEDFGCEEMEILHTKANLLEMYGFMQQLVRYLIENNTVLDPEQKLVISETESCSVTRSAAVAFDGETLKIGYRCE